MVTELASRLPEGMEKEDLYGYGCIGLMEAWRKYDPERQPNFMTYAYRRIKGEMLTGIREWTGMRPYRTKLTEDKPKAIKYKPVADIISKGGSDSLEEERLMRIILSAGHDNRWYGAENQRYGLREHTCALQVCDLVMSAFRNNPQVKFLDTLPHQDTFSHRLDSLDWKIHVINEMPRIEPIDLAIELHFNACESHNAHGAEVLYVSKAGKKYAKIFQPLLENFDGKYDGREIKHFSTLKFLNETIMPAIILEPLFLDNTWDVQSLLTYRGRRKVADAIVEGIREAMRKDYKSHVEKSGARVLT